MLTLKRYTQVYMVHVDTVVIKRKNLHTIPRGFHVLVVLGISRRIATFYTVKLTQGTDTYNVSLVM